GGGVKRARAAGRLTIAAGLGLALLLAAALPPARADGKPPAKKPPAFPAIEKKLDAGDIAGARQDLDKLLAAEPENRKANGLAARIRFFYADDAAARKLLAKADPEDEDAAILARFLDGPFAGSPAKKTGGGHYLLATDVTKRDGVATLLEEIYGAYSHAFPGERDRRLVSRVFVFARRDDYLSWSKEVLDDDASDSAAYYLPSFRLLVVDADGEDELSDYGRDSMFHEAFHQFLHYFLDSDRTPFWFNEGVAEYFGPSRVRPGGRALEIGLLPRGDGTKGSSTLDTAKRTLDRWTPLRRLMLLDADGFMAEEDALMHYAESWATVHFLAQSDEGRKRLLAYYDALRKGKTQQEAFERVFAGSVDRLEADVKDYVRKLKAPD
ncbi:MAG TPA: DUF1570 domain-containing protein, partial [Planctomycetota bacterium]|nr:DUF1570 domain-containing protein [Planctomycetota bacterium]